MSYEWAMLAGMWQRDDAIVTYLGPEDPSTSFAHGLALSSARLRNGSITMCVSLQHINQSGGRVLFSYNASNGAYLRLGWLVTSVLMSLASLCQEQDQEVYTLPEAPRISNLKGFTSLPWNSKGNR